MSPTALLYIGLGLVAGLVLLGAYLWAHADGLMDSMFDMPEYQISLDRANREARTYVKPHFNPKEN